MRNQLAIDAEIKRLLSTGRWTRVVCLCTDSRLLIQAAKWAASLLSVNPRYVLDPSAIVSYIRGPNWNDPDVGCAYYECEIKYIGAELHEEFASYRDIPMDEAARRFRVLQQAIGLKPMNCA